MCGASWWGILNGVGNVSAQEFQTIHKNSTTENHFLCPCIQNPKTGCFGRGSCLVLVKAGSSCRNLHMVEVPIPSKDWKACWQTCFPENVIPCLGRRGLETVFLLLVSSSSLSGKISGSILLASLSDSGKNHHRIRWTNCCNQTQRKIRRCHRIHPLMFLETWILNQNQGLPSKDRLPRCRKHELAWNSFLVSHSLPCSKSKTSLGFPQ